MRRAFGAAGGALGLVGIVALFYSSSSPAAGPRQLHAQDASHPDGTHCVDVWDNAWCAAQKADGKCVENFVLTKCLGTCGSCCIDIGDVADPEFCAKVHAAGQCFAHSSKCMDTCGVCHLDARLDCSFEDGRGHEDFCFYEKSYNPAGAADFFGVSTFNEKVWTGPRKASDLKYFAHLDSEGSAENDCAFLTSPWGMVHPDAVLVFDYNQYTRDYPHAMGTMMIDVLHDHEEHGWEELWTQTGTSAEFCAAGWTTDFVAIGEADAGPMRVRFHMRAGNDALSDMAIDNIRVMERTCGDGKRVFEWCDDGNTKSGDGCNAACEIEDGYRCWSMEDAPDKCRKLSCGDGVVTDGEECDDGNSENGDGCSKQCALEEGFFCDTEPAKCLDMCRPYMGQDVPFTGTSDCFAVRNGSPRLMPVPDKYVPDAWKPFKSTGTDDEMEPWAEGVLTIYENGAFKGVCENTENWKLAQVACFELGYATGMLIYDNIDVEWQNGNVCDPQGRGTHDHGFLCDETARRVDDCVSCAAECTDAIVVRCEYSGVCGDGFRRHSLEVCDDGNEEDGDGCSSDCQVEAGWVCNGGGWNSKDTCELPVCGDGKRSSGEACDDGNVEAGDGCSAACIVEDGYWCEGGTPATKDECTAIGTIRLHPNLVESATWPMVLSGPLQVMAENGWGSVCRKGFDLKDANNACEQVGVKYVDGKAMWVQSPGIKALPALGPQPVKWSGGCCMQGMPQNGLFYRCGVDENARCDQCDEVVHLTCGSDP